MPMQMIGRPILRKQVRLLNGSPSGRKLIFLDLLSLLQTICYRSSKYFGWYSIFCRTDPPVQHCGLLFVWPWPISWRFLDIPSVQLLGIPSDARIFPYVWTPVLQLRHLVQTCCIFYSQFVSILFLHWRRLSICVSALNILATFYQWQVWSDGFSGS